MFSAVWSPTQALRCKVATGGAFIDESTGIKPTMETVETYELAISRFRSQSSGSALKGLNDLLLEPSEAFRDGQLLNAATPARGVRSSGSDAARPKELNVTAADKRGWRISGSPHKNSTGEPAGIGRSRTGDVATEVLSSE